ncbi:MAG: VWA domain-containing protein [Deltaproteobacteria bacterium]|nr:VWA domain-containing protein [Deltaproteobacteria bacterium]
MSFLTWAALAVGLLVAAPLVAHLLRRRPPDEEAFAATRLVPPNPAVAQRRTALEDRALFAIRALAILALALLGATPFLKCSRLSLARQSGASVALAIVLDDSLSMRATVAGDGEAGSRFERAHQAAEELVSGLGPGDSVAIILAGAPPRVALAATTNLDAVKTALGRVEQTDRGTDLDGAVRLGAELLRALRHVDKRVVVLSDLADGGPDAPALEVPSGVKLWVPLAELRGAVADCAVTVADRVGDRVAVRVACSPAEGGADGGVSPATDRRIEVRAGDEVLVGSPLRLVDHSADVVLTLPQAAQDKHAQVRLYAVLTGADGVAVNDLAPVVSLGGQLRVGIVSNEPAARVATGGPPPVEQALAALEVGARLQPLTTVPERAEDLEPLGLLIVDDVPGFTPTQRRLLASWVEKGGVMLITLGPRAAAAPLGSGFSPLLPAIVRWSKTPQDGLDLNEDAVFGEAAAGLDAIAARGRAQLDLESPADLRTLVKWKDGAPLLLERRLGRGVAYSLTLPFSTEQSDLALRPGFLALLLRMVDTARSLGGVARTVVGMPWSLEGFERVEVARLTRQDERIPLAVAQAPGASVQQATVELAGLYELTLDGSTVYRVAAVDEAEVDLRPRPAPDAEGASELGGMSAAVDVSAYVAIGLLALLFGELLLRALAPRRRSRGRQSVG